MDARDREAGDGSVGLSAGLMERLGIPFRTGVPLGPMTWYGVGGCAEALAEPRDERELASLLVEAREAGVEVRVLGGGANLLVRDEGVGGVVVRLDPGGIWGRIDLDPDRGTAEGGIGRIVAGGAADLFELVQAATRAGLDGLTCLAGVPGTVGGAVRMNAGGGHGCVADVLRSIRVARPDGRVETVKAEALGLGYRRSDLGDGVVIEADFDLTVSEPAAIRERVKSIFAEKKRSQPIAEHSSGCAFKNPPAADGSRLSAGRLIDEAGLKGYRVGAASVSTVHANFVVLDRGQNGRPVADARAEDVLAVIEHVRSAVLERFGVRLEREVVVWP